MRLQQWQDPKRGISMTHQAAAVARFDERSIAKRMCRLCRPCYLAVNGVAPALQLQVVMPHRADCCVSMTADLILLPRAEVQLIRGGTCSTGGFRGVPVAGSCHTDNCSGQRCRCLPKERSWKLLHVRGGRANARAHCFPVGCCQVLPCMMSAAATSARSAV